MKNNNFVIVLLVAVITAGISFFGGMKYQQSKQSTSGQFYMMRNGQRAQNGNRMMGGFRPVTGNIIAIDDKSITVKLQDGSSKIVLLSDNTQINKASSASKSDLKEGETVAVFGQANTDGSLTAQDIQLNPVFRNITSPTPTSNQ